MGADHCLFFYCMYLTRPYNHSGTCMIQAQTACIVSVYDFGCLWCCMSKDWFPVNKRKVD